MILPSLSFPSSSTLPAPPRPDCTLLILLMINYLMNQNRSQVDSVDSALNRAHYCHTTLSNLPRSLSLISCQFKLTRCLSLMLVIMQEVALLKSIVEAAIGVLARCFEKYYAVSDTAASGILDGNVAATESPAPILHQAVLLAGAVFILLIFRTPSGLMIYYRFRVYGQSLSHP